MVEGWFSKPVPIAVGIAGDIRIVESAREAMSFLTGSWRNLGSEKHKAATRACQAATRGDAPSGIARQAFVDAAEEARILAG